MAKKELKVRKRNYARPTVVATASATTNTDSTAVTVSYTLPAIQVGPVATSYLVTGTSSTGTPVSTAITSSGTNVQFSPGQTYDVTIAAQNYNGPGEALAAATGLTIPSTYQLAATANTTTTYTVPNWATKIAGYVIGAGGGGGTGGASNVNAVDAGGGGGGGSGAIGGFKDYTVSGGTVITLNVGTATGISGTGNASTLVAGNTTLVTANGGVGGGTGGAANANNAHGTRGNGGAGGTATNNVAGGVSVSGTAGGNGSSPASNQPENGVEQSSTSNVTGVSNITAILPGTNNALGGSGGGGGSKAYGYGATGATGGGNGGYSNNTAVYPSNAANGPAGGGGGGGAGILGTPASAGGLGFAGRILLYVSN